MKILSARTYGMTLLAAIAAASLATGCRTSETNYRAAYEKTVGTDGYDGLRGTIYDKRRHVDESPAIVSGNDTIHTLTLNVAVTADGGGIRENLRQYSVVAAQFKQKFNAQSMRERLLKSGYPGAFVVETGEPYYYVVAASFASRDEAVKSLKELKESQPVVMKAPLPFILEAARLSAAGKPVKR